MRWMNDFEWNDVVWALCSDAGTSMQLNLGYSTKSKTRLPSSHGTCALLAACTSLSVYNIVHDMIIRSDKWSHGTIENQRALWASWWMEWFGIQNVSWFTGWLNYPHCAEIQWHAHRVVAVWHFIFVKVIDVESSICLSRIHTYHMLVNRNSKSTCGNRIAETDCETQLGIWKLLQCSLNFK